MYAIRSATPDDAPALARLLTELGYPTTPADVPARLERLLGEGSAALVAVAPGDLVLGFVTVAHHATLHAGQTGYITGLVTASEARGTGIGRALVDAARAWARAAGCVRISVTSAEERAGAHAFYPRCGMPYTGRRFSAPLA